jgi:nucleotide-binding universal stress UspA family protein
MADARSNTPRVWTNNSDLATLAGELGPFVTVCLSTPGDQENAEQHNMAQWRERRDGLATMGASEVCLKAIDEAVAEAHMYGTTLYAIADDSGMRHISHLHTQAPLEFATRETLPIFGALLAKRQEHIPHICATADRLGAQITCYENGGNALHRVVEGDPTDPIRKVQMGGWSQRRYQMRAEDTWDHNAKDVAAALEHMTADCKPRAIFLAGDVRAVQLIESHLSSATAQLVAEVAGSRANDGQELIDTEHVAMELARIAADDTTALLDKYAEEKGQKDRAAGGVQDVIDALEQGRVEVLLVPDRQNDERQCWFGEQPSQIALSEHRVRALGARDARGGRLSDALIRSAIGSGSGIRVVGANLMTEDYAALLRW